MVLEERMTVMHVKPNYSIIHQFRPFLKIPRRGVKSKFRFLQFLKDITYNWKEGNYFLKTSKGTFAHFAVNGKRVRRVRLLKRSKCGKEYLCWAYFRGGRGRNGNGVRNGRKVLK